MREKEEKQQREKMETEQARMKLEQFVTEKKLLYVRNLKVNV